MRILVVEDEPLLADAVAKGLRLESFAVDVARDGDQALAKAAVTAYDAVVLDRDLPGIHGDEVCRRLVAAPDAPRILMLTAAAALADRVTGLELGADDYLVKPFEFEELVARLRALGRRTPTARPPVRERAGIRLDPFRREVYRDGRLVRLARKEFAVLAVLMEADGGVVSAEALLEKAWDENADPFTNAVRITVSTLRKRLGAPGPIETVPGVGYRIADRPEHEDADAGPRP
ncbi:Transcriptional regulatory protein TcrA [Clavibacter michiganensis]|uniref:Transcriptional regulatory protein TcrA n=1 Tax=Clavibacter michiganensis TaxID=28447 RepID=A0A251Y7W9_9MICO|nr:response regulator transcription factor [Clavibacter michiganensis]OUE20341.1 Transcriptional regulatory protein TcrA [Clavibacter michiganensis]